MSSGDTDGAPRETIHERNLRFWSAAKLTSEFLRRVANNFCRKNLSMIDEQAFC